MRRYFGRTEAEMVNDRLIALIVLIAALFTGHIVDHAVRGDIAWDLTWPSVLSLIVNGGIFLLIALGLVLYVNGHIGPGVWAIAAVLGLALGWFGHLSPFTEQTPQYIYGCYNSPAAGALALGIFFALMIALAVALIYAAQLWIRTRREAAAA